MKQFIDYLRVHYGAPEQLLSKCGEILPKYVEVKNKIDIETAERVKKLFEAYYAKKHQGELAKVARKLKYDSELRNALIPRVNQLLKLSVANNKVTQYSNSKIDDAFRLMETLDVEIPEVNETYQTIDRDQTI
jgi:hypothetical protein